MSVYSQMHKLTYCIYISHLSSPLLFFQPKDMRNRLSLWSKLCFAIGGAPYQITGSALGFFLQIYLLDVAQVIDGGRDDTRETSRITGVIN